MFEHYSVEDLFANLYKKRKMNLLVLIVLFALIAVPFTLTAVKNKNTVKDTSSYSTYITYKITPPEDSSKVILNHQAGRYSDFYAKLIDGNLNGAFLFNDVDSDKMKKIASDLDTTESALKNSTSDYWTKKLTVNSLIDDAGVSIKILTPSKEVNDFLEIKFDSLIDKFKSTYANVKIEKLETVNSKELNPSGEITVGFNLKNLVLRLAVIGVLCVVLLIMGNVLVYIFNPTINRAGDFLAYQLDFVSNITTNDNLSQLLSYRCEGQPLAVVSSDSRILKKLQENYKLNIEGIHFVDLQNVKDLLATDNVLFVEEYGVTRYKKFEESLQMVRNLNRSVLGVIAFNL